MRVLRCYNPEVRLRLLSGEAGREALDVRRRQDTADVAGTVRCPRCGGELVARMSRIGPGFWCRCPVRRVLAEGA